MNDRVYPICKALSSLKKTLNDKEFRDFWSVTLRLMNDGVQNKNKSTEDDYKSILKYYCVGKDKSETFRLMEETAKHYAVYDLFLQTFKAAYEKETRKLSSGVIDMTCQATLDAKLRDDYLRHLSNIWESLDVIEPQYYNQLSNPASSGNKFYSDIFEKELYHQLRIRDISMNRDHRLLVKTKGERLLQDLRKLSKNYTIPESSNCEINFPRFIYSKDLVASIKHIPIKHRDTLNDIVKNSDIVCFFMPNREVKPKGNDKATFACMTLSEVLKKVNDKRNINNNN